MNGGRPESGEPQVCDGDSFGIVRVREASGPIGIPYFWNVMELESVPDETETRFHLRGY